MSSCRMCKLTLTVFFSLLQLSKWCKVSTGREFKNPNFASLPHDFNGFNVSPTDTPSEKRGKDYFALELVWFPNALDITIYCTCTLTNFAGKVISINS